MSEIDTGHPVPQNHATDLDAQPNAPIDESVIHPMARRHRRSRAQAAGLAAAGLLLLSVGAGGGALAARQFQAAQPAGGSSAATTVDGSDRLGSGTAGGSSDGTSASSAATAAQTIGIVTIDTQLGYQGGAAAGTGVILSSAGEILTNNHVVAGATSIRVTVESTNTAYTATVVGTDATDDIAVLQLNGAADLQPAPLSTAAASTGDIVTAVGNAGGTGTLLTATGTVTGLGQTITTQSEGSAASETLHGLIQTDADVVPGDSGGPLTNSTGAVIGIDTAASSGTRSVASYAIPVADALNIVQKIRAGVNTSTITIGSPAFLGVEVDGSATSDGATIAGVLDGTPAAAAGITANDVITRIDGTAVHSGDGLTKALKTHAPGDIVTITWTSARGDTGSAQVTLIAGPAN